VRYQHRLLDDDHGRWPGAGQLLKRLVQLLGIGSRDLVELDLIRRWAAAKIRRPPEPSLSSSPLPTPGAHLPAPELTGRW
jgi:hypothetical protein